MHAKFALLSWSTVVLAAGANAAATGSGARAPAPHFCKSVDNLVTDLLHAPRAASTFCSSYLHIKTATHTTSTTVTPSATTVTVSATATSLSTTTVVTTVGPSSTSMVSATTTEVAMCTEAAGPAKKRRDVAHWAEAIEERAVAVPACISDSPAAEVSKACSCIITSTPTVTTTVTSTAASPTSTVSTTTTVVSTVTTTSTSTITSIPTETLTVTATTTIPAGATGTYTASDSLATFIEFENLDYYGDDLGSCYCDDSDGYECSNNYGVFPCNSFDDCQDICAAINNIEGQLLCVAAVYTPNGTPNSGYIPKCYPKSATPGCGQVESYETQTGLLNTTNYQYS